MISGLISTHALSMPEVLDHSSPNSQRPAAGANPSLKSAFSSQATEAVITASAVQPPTAISPAPLRRLTTAFPSASNAVISRKIAETVLARLPSLSGFRCGGTASGESSSGNVRLTSRGKTIAPHQNATAPSSSTRPAHSAKDRRNATISRSARVPQQPPAVFTRVQRSPSQSL